MTANEQLFNPPLFWVRVGDGGAYEKFDFLDEVIEYLNELRVGQVTQWVRSGFETPNYHGGDYISLYWGAADANHVADLGDCAKETVEFGLEEHYL